MHPLHPPPFKDQAPQATNVTATGNATIVYQVKKKEKKKKLHVIDNYNTRRGLSGMAFNYSSPGHVVTMPLSGYPKL